MSMPSGRCSHIHVCFPLQAEMLSPESLCGDNQFFCDFCDKKADATRQLCLQQLPPYLCLSLQRFVFDMKVLPCFL